MTTLTLTYEVPAEHVQHLVEALDDLDVDKALTYLELGSPEDYSIDP